MTESTTPAETTPGTPDGIADLSAKFDKLTDAISGLVTAMAPKAPVESAPAAPVAEQAAPAPAPVQETQEQMIARLVAEGVKAALPVAVQETVERYGPPTRKGLVRPVTENAATGAGHQGLPEGWPDTPLHTYTPEERAQFLEPAVINTFLKGRA